MRTRSVLIAFSLLVVTSVIIAFVVVSRTPSLTSGGWIATSTTKFSRPWYEGPDYGYLPEAVTELAKREPAEAQAIVKELWDTLMQVDEADLYRFKWLPDVCIEVDCQGVPSKDVKPYVDLVLSYKQSAAKVIREQIAIVLSVAALLISIAGLVVKRKA